MFFGQIAVTLFDREGSIPRVTKEVVEKALLELAEEKAKAACEDMKAILGPLKFVDEGDRDGTGQAFWMKPHLGNQGRVNDQQIPARQSDAASAAANMGVLLAALVLNGEPSLGYTEDDKKLFQGGVESAYFLTKEVLHPTRGDLESYTALLKQSLRTAALLNPDVQPEMLETHLTNRLGEVEDYFSHYYATHPDLFPGMTSAQQLFTSQLGQIFDQIF
jgi:hypothetical protein